MGAGGVNLSFQHNQYHGIFKLVCEYEFFFKTDAVVAVVVVAVVAVLPLTFTNARLKLKLFTIGLLIIIQII